jgi:hypothetical protein
VAEVDTDLSRRAKLLEGLADDPSDIRWALFCSFIDKDNATVIVHDGQKELCGHG